MTFLLQARDMAATRESDSESDSDSDSDSDKIAQGNQK